eukprot:TRINITY_DN7490_c0_g2_i1.p1 TRINITY_DN7490_c0_g2~~TRINITY_DN7490_c0_g2_i1.p1  ORF type:complete len:1205 (-),score=365.63 TRINITY_DN7490_c0_g2_i1:30-3644(-)
MTAIPVVRSGNQQYILKEEDEESLRQLIESTRETLDQWYVQKTAAQALEELQNKGAKKKSQKIEGYQKLKLEDKTDDEVIVVLKHRDLLMKSRAVAILEERLRKEKSEEETRELVTKLRRAARLVVAALDAEDAETIVKVLYIFATIMSEQFSEIVRQVGGITTISKVLGTYGPKIVNDDKIFSTYLVYVIFRLSKNEANKEAFRSSSGLLPLVPFMFSKFDNVREISTEALLNLTDSDKNRSLVAERSNAIQICFENLKEENFPTENHKTSIIYLLRNLGACAAGQKQMNQDNWKQLIDFLNPAEAYSTDEEKLSYFQKGLLLVFMEMAASERNKRLIGQMGGIPELIKYFAPLNPQTELNWNYEVLEILLSIFDHLVKLDENRAEFLKNHGLSFLAAITQQQEDANNFPEQCVVNAAQVITTICVSAYQNEDHYVRLGVSILLELLDKNPNSDHYQLMVVQLFKSLSQYGNTRDVIMDNGGVQTLIKIVKECLIKEILGNATRTLARLSTDASVAEEMVSNELVPILIGLLQIEDDELQSSIAECLCNISEIEEGAVQIAKNGGITPLVHLLRSTDENVVEAALIAFAKILFNRDYGLDYRRYFSELNGEKLLIEMMESWNNEKVLIPNLTILSALSQIEDGRENVHKAGLQLKLEELERKGKFKESQGQVPNLLRVIKVNIKKYAAENRQKIKQQELDRQEKAREEEYDKLDKQREELLKKAEEYERKKKIKSYWIKIQYEGVAKVISVSDNYTFSQLTHHIGDLFGLNEWKAMSYKEGKDLVAVEEQSDLDYVIDQCADGKKVVIIIHAVNPAKTDNSEKSQKLSELFKELSLNQMRTLLKEAVSSGSAQTVTYLKSYINSNRGIPRNIQDVDENDDDENKKNSESKSSSANTTTTSSTESTSAPKKITAPPPPPPPIMKENPTLGRKNLSKSTTITNDNIQGGNAVGNLSFIDELKGGKELRKTEKPTTTSSSSSKENDLFSQIISGTKLRRVEMSDTTVVDDHHLKKSVVNANKSDDTNTSITNDGSIKLINQGVSEGRKYWINQPERYIDTLEKVVSMDYKMLELLFNLIQSDMTVYFNELHATLNDPNAVPKKDFAQALLSIGFNLRYREYVLVGNENDTPIIEYIIVLPPYDLPVAIITKTIYSLIGGLHGSDGGEDDDEFEVENIVEELSITETLTFEPITYEVEEEILELPLM